MESIDYILALSNTGGDDFEDRVENLNFILKTFLSYQTKVDLKIYLIEQIVNPELPTILQSVKIPENLTVITKTVSYPMFVKTWLWNIGIGMSSGDFVMLADGDAWVDKDYFHELPAFLESENLKWCFGWKQAVELTLKNKTLLIRDGYLERNESGVPCPNKMDGDRSNASWGLNYDEYGYLTPRINRFEGYLLFFKRHFLVNDLGGSNEMFRELGANDNEIVFRAMKTSGTYVTYPVVIVHLWHRLSKMKFTGSWDLNQRLFQFTTRNDNYSIINNYLKSNKLGGELPLELDFKNQILSQI